MPQKLVEPMSPTRPNDSPNKKRKKQKNREAIRKRILRNAGKANNAWSAENTEGINFIIPGSQRTTPTTPDGRIAKRRRRGGDDNNFDQNDPSIFVTPQKQTISSTLSSSSAILSPLDYLKVRQTQFEQNSARRSKAKTTLLDLHNKTAMKIAESGKETRDEILKLDAKDEAEAEEINQLALSLTINVNVDTKSHTATPSTAAKASAGSKRRRDDTSTPPSKPEAKNHSQQITRKRRLTKLLPEQTIQGEHSLVIDSGGGDAMVGTVSAWIISEPKTIDGVQWYDDFQPFTAGAPKTTFEVVSEAITKAHLVYDDGTVNQAIFKVHNLSLNPDPTEDESLCIPDLIEDYGGRVELRMVENSGECGVYLRREGAEEGTPLDFLPLNHTGREAVWNVSQPNKEDFDNLPRYTLSNSWSTKFYKINEHGRKITRDGRDITDK